MALSQSLRFSSTPPNLSVQTTTTSNYNPRSILPIRQRHVSFPLRPPTSTNTLTHRRSQPLFISRAKTENGSETTSTESDTIEAETTGQEQEQTPEQPSSSDGGAELSEVGQELKRMMKERADKEGEGKSVNFLTGVAEEIGQIEWPEFNKVVGITGVVLGVIAGSSVVLLTVNAVLAEISDKVFVGKGVQDFFG